MHRLIIMRKDGTLAYVYPKDGVSWETSKKRAYRTDHNAVCQVLNKSGQIKPLTESIYFEASSVPLRSKMNDQTLGNDLIHELFVKAGSKVESGFFDFLRRS